MRQGCLLLDAQKDLCAVAVVSYLLPVTVKLLRHQKEDGV